MTSTVTSLMTVCASVSTTRPVESLVTAMKLSISTAVCYHNCRHYSNLLYYLGFKVRNSMKNLVFIWSSCLVSVAHSESAMANAMWEIFLLYKLQRMTWNTFITYVFTLLVYCSIQLTRKEQSDSWDRVIVQWWRYADPYTSKFNNTFL